MITQVYQAVVTDLKDIISFNAILEKIVEVTHSMSPRIANYTYDGNKLIMYVEVSLVEHEQYSSIKMEVPENSSSSVAKVAGAVQNINITALDKKVLEEHLTKKYSGSNITLTSDGSVQIINDTGSILVLRDHEFKLETVPASFGENDLVEIRKSDVSHIDEINNSDLSEEEIKDTFKEMQKLFEDLSDFDNNAKLKDSEQRQNFINLLQTLDDIDNGKEVEPSKEVIKNMTETEKNVKIMKDLLDSVREVDKDFTTMAKAVKGVEVDEDKKMFITEFSFRYEKDATLDDIYTSIYNLTGERYILNYGVSKDKIFYIVESNGNDVIDHKFRREVFAKEYNDLYHPDKFSDMVFKAKNRLHSQLEDLVDFQNANLMKFSSTFSGERIAILDLDAEKLAVEKESEVQILTEEEVDFITLESKAFETIEVYTAVISFDSFDDYAAKHNIIGWDLTTPSTLQIKFTEGVTHESQIKKFHDMMNSLDSGWLASHKAELLENTKFLSELHTLMDTDLADEFVRRVNKHNVFVRESMSKIRSALLDMENDFKRNLSSEVNLTIDWDNLTAFASKKERITHRSTTQVRYELKDKSNAVLVRDNTDQEFYIPVDLLTDEILSKYCIEESEGLYVEDVVDYAFYKTNVNGLVMLIEKTDF